MFPGCDCNVSDGFCSYGILAVWSPPLGVQIVWRHVLAGQQFLSLGRRESLPGPHGRGASSVGFVVLRLFFDRILRLHEGDGK